MSGELRQALAAAWGRPGQGILLRGDGRPAIAQAAGLARRRGGLAAAAVCSFAVDGPYAGVSRLLQAVVRGAERRGLGDLAAAHADSLAALAPALARRYPPRHPILSVTAPPREAVRSFGPDWATRHVNGVVDFLLALQDRLGGAVLCLGLVDLDRAGPLAGELFYHLARRAGGRPLLLWAGAAAAPAAWQRLGPLLQVQELALPATGGQREPAPAGAAEARCGRRIAAAVQAGAPAAACRLLAAAIDRCQRYGLAADAAALADRWLQLVDGAPPERRIPALLQVMGAALPLGRPAAAERTARALLALPLTPRQRATCLYTLAMLHTRYYAQRNLALAEQYIDASLAALGDAPPPDALAFYRNGKALVLLRQGRAGEAAALCEQALRDLSARPRRCRLQRAVLLDNLGRVHMALGEYAEAVRSFSAALALDPHYSELYQERGSAYQRLGQYAEALADFDRGIACGPPSAPLAASRGNLWLETGQPARGIADFTRALELDSELAYAYKARALCHADCGHLQAALADYDAYLSRRPQDADALSNRGSLRHDLGDRAGAVADLDAALRLDPGHVAALANRAAVRADLGQWEQALADLERAIALAPDLELLHRSRSQVLQQLGR